ncbi:MAG: ribosomal protection-like ABC-F family protein [Cellulosilyticaceae bacterium]
MPKITISKMSYYYVDFYNPVFENVNLNLKSEWKIGLIGRNGRGKTTLLKLLQGELEPTAGKINMPMEVEYFPYTSECAYTRTMDRIKEYVGQLKSIEDTMEQIIAENDEGRFDEYAQLQDHYLELDGYEMESKILKEMDDMGLDPKLLERDFDTLSGGEKTRIMLLTLFLRKKQFILLDEPTNHLDEAGKDAVAQYLQKKKGFILVSHDREFLDRVIDHVLSINKKDITIEHGNYSSWKANKEKREQYELRTKERLEEEIEQLERSARVSRTWAQWGNTQKYQFASNGRANGVQTYMKQAKRSEARAQDNLEYKKSLLQNYEEVKALTLYQDEEDDSAGCLVRADKLSFAYPDATKKVLRNLSLEIETGDRIWVKGTNGVGKSTLLRLLGGSLSHEQIQYAEGIKVAVVEQEPSWKSGYVSDYLEAHKGTRHVTNFLELCDVFELPENFLDRPLETYSSGELKKVNIAKALSEENHLIILDEPLNYMDTYFSEQLEAAILEYQPTIVFVEHDRWFGKKISTQTIHL